MKKFFSVHILAFLTLIVSAQSQTDIFVNNKLHQNANVSLMIKEAGSGKTMQSHRATNVATPASTLKIVTTATALEMLGSDYRFQTILETEGNIAADGTLNGNIYIRGCGDPTLGSSKIGDAEFLDQWVVAVKSSGIKRINGNIIADISAYDSEGVNPKWLWEDIGNYYAAGAYGISYKDNMYELELKSGAPGTSPEIVSIKPAVPDLKFTVYLKSTNIKIDSAYIYGAPGDYNRTIYGEIPANRSSFIVKGDIPQPETLLVSDFIQKLRKSGVEISGNMNETMLAAKRKTIHTHFSPALSEIVKEINLYSNNHYAEHLFRHLALQRKTQATTNEAIRTVRSFWASKGLPVDELIMQDGSGLSPTNAVSARFLVSLLQYMDKSKYRNAFRASLPIAGKSGTLRGFLKDSILAGKLIAKSGSASRVKSYAGYIERNGKSYTFAIIVNNPGAYNMQATTKKIEELLIQSTK